MRKSCVLVLGLCCLGAWGYAYTLIGAKWSAFPIGYEINTANGPANSGSIILAGFSPWEALSDCSVSFRYQGNVSRSISLTDQFNTVGFGTAFQAAGTLGITWTQYSGSTMVNADMELNSNSTLWSSYDLQSVVLHEAGHFIGIDHSGDINAVMYPTLGSGVIHRILGSDDMAAARSLYPGKEIVFSHPAPNPFKPKLSSDSASIFFDLGQAARVHIRIYNIAGELIMELLDESLPEGQNSVAWFGDNGGVGSRGTMVGSGVYLVVGTTSSGGKDVKKVMVVR